MHRHRRAFTIIELLITVGVILLLAGLIIVSLRGVRFAANRAETGNALRQMMIAYNAYSVDEKQRLMPGYFEPADLDAGGLFAGMKVSVRPEARLDLTQQESREDAASYVWRLAPYLDYSWKVMATDYRNPELIAALDGEFGAEEYGGGMVPAATGLGISRIPSFGLNSIFVGGDNVHGGDWAKDRNPWTTAPGLAGDVLAATRLSEVRNATRLVVFAPTAHWAEVDPNASDGDRLIQDPPISDIDFGYFELRAPMLAWDEDRNPERQQWGLRPNDNRIVTVGEFGNGGGVPIARWGKDLVPVAHLDGSVTTEKRVDLAQDFRWWSPFATGY